MTLTTEQVDALLAPLHPGRVRTAQGNAHLEAWDIRRHLLRVFGWGGWDFTVVSCDVVSERSKWDEQNPLKGRHTVVYRVLGRLTIRDTEGNVLAVYEDGATGDAANQPSLGDAHDMALKTAMSQALKRCAMNLGDRFGLSLYSKGSTAAVVGRSLAHEHAEQAPVVEDVQAGELDDQRERPAERGAVRPDADPWASNPVAAIPVVTDAVWAKDWRERVAGCADVAVLRGLFDELSGQVKAKAVSPEDATDLRALVEEQAADLTKQAERVDGAA